MSGIAAATGTVLDHVLAFVVPFFLTGAGADPDSARRAVADLLESYGPATDQDLLLAAEIVAFSLPTLDNLGRSVADPAMSITTRLRLRSNANALSRAAERNRQNLRRAKQGRTASATPLELPAELPAIRSAEPSSVQRVRDAIVEAAPSLAATLTAAGPTLSRQQRRFLMRKAEQARAAQEREARKTARLAPRAAAVA
jgi:hypothetical protein